MSTQEPKVGCKHLKKYFENSKVPLLITVLLTFQMLLSNRFSNIFIGICLTLSLQFKVMFTNRDELLSISLLQQYLPHFSSITFMNYGKQWVIEIMDGDTLIPPSGGLNKNVYNIFVHENKKVLLPLLFLVYFPAITLQSNNVCWSK